MGNISFPTIGLPSDRSAIRLIVERLIVVAVLVIFLVSLTLVLNFLEKLSTLNELRNYGDRWGKLRCVRKHQSHPAAPPRGQFKRFRNWFGKSKCPEAPLDLTVNFQYRHVIDPNNCPWVSEDVNESEIVEIKKVVLKEGELLDDGMCRLGIYKKNGSELIMNKNHKYYY